MRRSLTLLVLAALVTSACAQIPAPGTPAPNLRPQATQQDCEALVPQITGKPQDDALAAIQAAGLPGRLRVVDGEARVVSTEFVAHRVNLHIEQGKVSRAYCG